MIKITSLAAFAFLLLANTAHAATVDLDVTVGPSVTYGTGGTYTPNLNLFPPSSAGLSLTGDAFVLPQGFSIPNIVKSPTGTLFQNVYLGAIQDPGPVGTAKFTLGSNDNTFAFTWGTIDPYNTLALKLSGGGTVNLTGADILSHLAGSPTPGVTQANIKFFDPSGSILSAELGTTQNSFEAANFYEGSAVPLPSSLLLFGTALLALALFFRRRASIGSSAA